MIRPLKILTLILAASQLAACAVSTPSGRSRIQLPALPADVSHCNDPVLLPEVKLDQEQTEKFWRQDRMSLVKCKANNGVLVRDRENTNALLSGAAK